MEKVFPAIKDRISKLRVVRERYQGKTYEGENLYIVIIYTLYVQYITITSYWFALSEYGYYWLARKNSVSIYAVGQP